MNDKPKPPTPKPITWMGDTKEELRSYSEDVRRTVGTALRAAQNGKVHPAMKAMRHLGGGVVEIKESDATGTYRAVYTTRCKGRLFVLHVFPKKSVKGIATPAPDMNLIRSRLAAVKEQCRELEEQGEEGG